MTFRKIGDTAVPSPLTRVALVFMAVVFFLSATAFAVPPMMYNVTIYDGEKIITVATAETDGDEILEKQGITVNEAYGDSVSYANFTGEDGSVIIISRGVEVKINHFDGSQYTIYASGMVSNAIKKAGIQLAQGTALNYAATDLLEEGMVIVVYDIYPITVKVDGKTIKKTVSGKDVADALATLDITLGENDFTKPSVDTNLKKNMTISVYRVVYKERKATEKIKYGTDYTYSKKLYKDQKQLVKKGVYGSKAVVYEDCYINGKLHKSKVLSEDVLKEAVNQQVVKGTKKRPVRTYPSRLPVGKPISEMRHPSSLIIGSNGIPTKYRKVINAKATAYSGGGITSTGKKAQTGYIAVDPKEIPYGTQMYIVSADGRYVYGYCIAADTGSYIHSVDWTVDLYMNSEAQCRQWGRRSVIIYVL